MCTHLTATAEVSGSARAADGAWSPITRAVVYFDHPQDALVDHALCLDLWSTGTGGASPVRVGVELDAASARVLAETILATLDSDEVRALAGTQPPGAAGG